MKKDKVLQFISRYNLNGNVNQLSGKLTETTFAKPPSLPMTKVFSAKYLPKDFELTEGEVGVYDTAKLKQLLSVVGDEINVEVVEKNEKNVSINVSDDTTSVNFMLADLAVIPNAFIEGLADF